MKNKENNFNKNNIENLNDDFEKLHLVLKKSKENELGKFEKQLRENLVARKTIYILIVIFIFLSLILMVFKVNKEIILISIDITIVLFICILFFQHISNKNIKMILKSIENDTYFIRNKTLNQKEFLKLFIFVLGTIFIFILYLINSELIVLFIIVWFTILFIYVDFSFLKKNV